MRCQRCDLLVRLTDVPGIGKVLTHRDVPRSIEVAGNHHPLVDAIEAGGAADGYAVAVGVLRGVAERTGSPAARWAADYLEADPDRLSPRKWATAMTDEPNWTRCPGPPWCTDEEPCAYAAHWRPDIAAGSSRDTTPRCCDMHNEHCEPPSELCCGGCTEVAHDTFPIRHADGSRCVLAPTVGEP